MTILLDQRDDASLSLYIDGDLQFDSRDERIYHETLALPALALAERRHTGSLRALICGGGDGLIIRELLKSPRVARIDLVDYDPTVLALARAELAELNGRSLDHLCTHVYIADAWAFTQQVENSTQLYDLIITDLTVPQDVQGARLHSVEWYLRLYQLLGDDGLLAVNAASPSGTPEAYWSIYNSMRAAGLHPRPYRVALPSFKAAGYGDDWGFILASPRPIAAAEFDDNVPLAQPRHALLSAAQLRQLFIFPQAIAVRRADALPARDGSRILLHYLYNSAPLQKEADELWDGLADERDLVPLPKPDDGQQFLPPELREALASPIGKRPDEEALLGGVLELMPALQRFQTREMVKAFLADPSRFLAAIDLPCLVERLLNRAAELPRRLVAELRLLRSKLRDFVGNHAELLRLGMRIVTIVTLVVIVANLLYPDAVYGKGGDGTTSSNPVSLSRPSYGSYDAAATPDFATGGGFRDPDLGHGVAVDEIGSPFPARRYRYYPRYFGHSGYSSYRPGTRPSEQPEQSEALYRLTPETDILPDGKVAIMLSDAAYLLLDSEVATVIDQQTGLPLLFLDREPAQIWRAAKEIERQQAGLEQTVQAKQAWINWVGWLNFASWNDDDQRELQNLRDMGPRLEQARKSLGEVPRSSPPSPAPPVPGALEMFSGVWMLPDGSGLALRLPDELAFMDGKRLYHDQARTQLLDRPYPSNFKSFIVGYLRQQIKDSDATLARLRSNLWEEQLELAALQRDKAEYEAIRRTSPESEIVDYGTSKITLGEALRRTDADIAGTQQRIALIQQQIDAQPTEKIVAERLIVTLSN